MGAGGGEQWIYPYCLAVSRYCDGIAGTPGLRADIRAPDVTVTGHLSLAMGWLERAGPRFACVSSLHGEINDNVKLYSIQSSYFISLLGSARASYSLGIKLCHQIVIKAVDSSV